MAIEQDDDFKIRECPVDLPSDPAGRLQMIMEMCETERTCPTCGHVERFEPLISVEDARKLIEAK